MVEAHTADDDSPSVTGSDLAPMPTQQDREQAWRRLYIAKMVECGVEEEHAAANFDAAGFGPDAYDITDDPEQCALDEMSYWDDDGDE